MRPDDSPEANSSGLSDEWRQRDRVWACGLEKREKMILLAFLDYDREANGAVLFPSLGRIARVTGYSHNPVHAAVQVLEASGILEVVGYVSSRYELRGRVKKYRFHIDRLPPAGNRYQLLGRVTASVPRDTHQGDVPPAVEIRGGSVDDYAI